MNIAIIGAGFTGLTAARDLLLAHHDVTVFEASPLVGGLASGVKLDHWDWYVERFYHHIFKGDKAIIDLATGIGRRDMIFFNRQTTAFYCPEHGSHPVSLLGILQNRHLPFVDRVRYGFTGGVVLKARNDRRRLEQETARDHMLRWAGKRAYHQMWEPLLVGKFGPYADEVNAAWIWARAKTRSFKLGYFRGGFQSFADALSQTVTEQLGGWVYTNTPVSRIIPVDGRFEVHAGANTKVFDRVIVASGPGVLLKLMPELPDSYTAAIRGLKSMGAIVAITVMKQQLLTNGEYWFMPPKDRFPYLNIVEHTNMIDPVHYGDDHVVYVGDYLPSDHHYFATSDEQLLREWLPPLVQVNPAFREEWVKHTWVFRERYAQPVVPINHSAHVPSLHTPVAGAFFASLSHVYPWDRGTNFAVELGHRVADELLKNT
ncbi:MAG: NAD(P)/FAD-dependent oxidoreductase [Herpetosiphon sp.]